VATRRAERSCPFCGARVYAEGALDGWCPHCESSRRFTLARPSGAGWVNLREELLCSCGMNSRMRMILACLQEASPQARFLMLERVTPLFALVQERFPFVEGCEYFGDNAEPGSTHSFGGMDVRHENMLSFSYDNNSFEALFHGDVLEHVPDIPKALSECHRILKPGGQLLFTCPMTNLDRHITRARIEQGQLVHLLPPGYHGNPMDNSGVLVFTEPGLQLANDLRAAGFGRVELGLAFEPGMGILRDGNPYPDFNMWPIFFRAIK
jgi:SAM-dependent methyltransferase